MNVSHRHSHQETSQTSTGGRGTSRRRALLLGGAAGAAGLCALAACAGRPEAGQSGAATASARSTVEPQSTAGAGTATAGEGAAVLVAYFSATGNTRALAGKIAERLGADRFEIEPAQPYSEEDLNFNNRSSRVVEEYEDVSQRDTPLAVTTPAGFEGYSTVVLAYPIWWQDAAWPVEHFVTDNDFSGKTVITVCTSLSSGMGSSARNLEALAGSGTWQEGQRFSENPSDADVESWIASSGLGA